MPEKTIKKKESNKEFFVSISFFILFLALIILVPKVLVELKEDTCGDGTPYDSCSSVKPFYCQGGRLIEKASSCGCEGIVSRDSCIMDLNLQAAQKSITLNYIFDGKKKTIDFAVYKGLADYLSDIPRQISYSNGEIPNRAEFISKKINEEKQRQLLLPLAIEIQNLSNDKEEQAKIAISLVQNIPYGFSEKRGPFQGVNYSRYPYEVLYDKEGICGEKSELLAFLLREIGYETAIFYNQKENHEFVGIKCPLSESHKKTGYCFVETSGPAIISDDSIEYANGVTLESEPEIIPISEGRDLPEGLQEYRDADEIRRLKKNPFVLFRQSRLEKLMEKYGLIEEYFVE